MCLVLLQSCVAIGERWSIKMDIMSGSMGIDRLAPTLTTMTPATPTLILTTALETPVA